MTKFKKFLKVFNKIWFGIAICCMMIGIPLAKVRAENEKYSFTQESITITATSKSSQAGNTIVYFDVTNNTDVEIKYFSVNITVSPLYQHSKTFSVRFDFDDNLKPNKKIKQSVTLQNLNTMSTVFDSLTFSYDIESITCPDRGSVYLD